jgi:hypothetical protein
MSRISNELYVLADGVKPFDSYSCDAIKHVADQIDAEMVELPKDKNGEPIHVGDMLYFKDKYNDSEFHAGDFVYDGIAWRIWNGGNYDSSYRKYTHERPDSLERIVEDLENIAEIAHENGNWVHPDKCMAIADRLRELADDAE